MNWKLKTKMPVTGQLPEEVESSINESNVEGSELEEVVNSLSPEDRAELEKSHSTGSGDLDPRFKVEDSPRLSAGYDPSNGYYTYQFPNGSGFSMTVPLGALTDHGVNVRTDGEAFIPVYSHDNNRYAAKDHEEEEKITGFSAEETGGYDFTVESDTRRGSLWESYVSRISFRVESPDRPTDISYVAAPYGFEIGEIYLNGEKQSPDNRERTVLKEDGDYTFIFYPMDVPGAGEYRVSFKRDTTAPRVIFSEDINKGEIQDTLYFKAAEKDAVISIYRNGLKMSTVPDGISAGGDYHLEVYDTLGNSRGYDFSVKQKRSTPFSFYGLYLGGVLLIFLFVILLAKRNLRVL